MITQYMDDPLPSYFRVNENLQISRPMLGKSADFKGDHRVKLASKHPKILSKFMKRYIHVSHRVLMYPSKPTKTF